MVSGWKRTGSPSDLPVLANSFPYVKIYWSLENEGLHFLASMRPLTPPTVDQFVARMPDAAKKDLMEWESGDIRTVADGSSARKCRLRKF